jgi:hypothetical protein
LGIITVGALQAWAERHIISSDGLSYLNLSDAWASGDWLAGFNGYWSPLYPALLGLARVIFSPSPEDEATVLHAVNFAFMVLSLVGFELCLAEIQAGRKPVTAPSTHGDGSDEPLWWLLLVYGLFAWGALELIGVGISSPDMVGSAALYFAAALTLRSMRRPSPGIFAALGVVLAFGYLARAALFVIGALWAVLIAVRLGGNAPLRWRVITMATFFLVAGPAVALISLKSGRLTFSDAARVNKGWFVSRYPFIWTGRPEGSGTPVHAPLVVNEEPLVVAYPGSAGSSYPYFDDPSYWTAGMIPRPNLVGQRRTTRRQLKVYFRYLGPIAGCVLMLSLLSKPRTVVLRDFAARSAVTIPLSVLLAVYAAIVTQPRFFAVPAVVLSLLGLDALRNASSPPPKRILVGVAAVGLLWSLYPRAADVVHQILMVVREASGARIPHDQYKIASALTHAGLRRGDKVGTIGSAMGSYWARLAGVRVSAELPDKRGTPYWSATDSVREHIDAKLFGAGARVIVARDAADYARFGWQPLAAGYFIKWAPAEESAYRKAAEPSSVIPR